MMFLESIAIHLRQISLLRDFGWRSGLSVLFALGRLAVHFPCRVIPVCLAFSTKIIVWKTSH